MGGKDLNYRADLLQIEKRNPDGFLSPYRKARLRSIGERDVAKCGLDAAKRESDVAKSS